MLFNILFYFFLSIFLYSFLFSQIKFEHFTFKIRSDFIMQSNINFIKKTGKIFSSLIEIIKQQNKNPGNYSFDDSINFPNKIYDRLDCENEKDSSDSRIVNEKINTGNSYENIRKDIFDSKFYKEEKNKGDDNKMNNFRTKNNEPFSGRNLNNLSSFGNMQDNNINQNRFSYNNVRSGSRQNNLLNNNEIL